MDSVTERWLPVKDFEGVYEVSNLGRVRRIATGRVLRAGMTGKRRNYSGVRLHHGLLHASRKIHHLVMEAFVGAMPHGMQVNHRDGDPTNNRLDNLEYVTGRQNIRHAHDNGLAADVRGERHPGAILTEEKVRQIRKLTATETQRCIAARFGVSQSTVGAINTGRLWKHLVTG